MEVVVRETGVSSRGSDQALSPDPGRLSVGVEPDPVSSQEIDSGTRSSLGRG